MKKPQTTPRKPPPRAMAKLYQPPAKQPDRHEVKPVRDPFKGQKTFML